jgi:hypothetical protein
MSIWLYTRLIRLHYRLMDAPRYWYRADLRQLDGFVCRVASDLKARNLNLRRTGSNLRWMFVPVLLSALKETE